MSLGCPDSALVLERPLVIYFPMPALHTFLYPAAFFLSIPAGHLGRAWGQSPTKSQNLLSAYYVQGTVLASAGGTDTGDVVLALKPLTHWTSHWLAFPFCFLISSFFDLSGLSVIPR